MIVIEMVLVIIFAIYYIVNRIHDCKYDLQYHLNHDGIVNHINHLGLPPWGQMYMLHRHCYEQCNFFFYLIKPFNETKELNTCTNLKCCIFSAKILRYSFRCNFQLISKLLMDYSQYKTALNINLFTHFPFKIYILAVIVH